MVKIDRHMAPLTRTSGRGNKRKYITIHETANRGRGANANAHARLQAGTNSRQASWHYQVDDTRIIQSFDDDVRCWHAGAKANNESIAIEICVNSDGDYSKALDNAAALVAHLRSKHNIPWNRIVSHKFWTGKNCPTIMLSRKGQWDKFIKATDPKGSNKVTTSTTKPAASKPKPKPAPKKTYGEWPTHELYVDGKFWLITKRGYQRLLAPKTVGDYRGTIDGDIGPRTVKAEQRWLKNLGYYGKGYIIDGQRGPMTIRALQSFLRSKRLYLGTIDGQFGPRTVRALQNYLNSQRKHYL